MKGIKFKLNIRSVKDAEGARKLYNICVFKGWYRQAKQIAITLRDFGYKGWSEKIDQLNRLIYG